MKQKYINNCLIILILILSIYFFIGIIEPIDSFIKELYYLLKPFIVGIIFAYIINPYVLKLRKRGVPKGVSIFICILFICYILVFLIMNLVPLLIEEINHLNENLPLIIDKLKEIIESIKEKASFIDINTDFLKINQLTFFNNIGKYMNVLFLAPVITLYVLNDYDKIVKKINKYTVKHEIIREYIIELNNHLLLYFDGMILIMVLLSLVSGLCFSILGLDYSLLLGFVIGITNIIPFIGPYIGGGIVFLYALTKSPIKAIISFIIVWILQTIESNFVTPYIQSKRISQSPLLILLSFTINGYLFGLFGMILAVPILSFVSLSIKYFLKYYRMKTIF